MKALFIWRSNFKSCHTLRKLSLILLNLFPNSFFVKKIVFIFFLIVSSLVSYSQLSNSNWSGMLNAGGQKIELRLHLIQNPDKTYSSNWDVPLQKAKGIPSSKTALANNQLTIEVKMIGASYTGMLNAAGNAIEGTWGQSGMSFPLNMEPLKEALEEKELMKPQTPKPPFNYSVKDFTYEGANTKLTYGATLTYPNENKMYPLVILITGSGRQDRDETIFDHKPFAVIADYLTKKGFAVLRVDDRGAGKSTGDFSKSTTADFALDVEEHIRYVKSLPMIDSTKIGLLGHSEGGLIAPMVAARNNSVSFIVLMAGPGIEITQLMAVQNEMVLKSAGIDQPAIDAYVPLYKQLMKTIISIDNNEEAINQSKKIVNEWFRKTDKTFVKSTTNISTEADIDKFATTMAQTLSTSWWKFFAAYNPQPTLQKVKCPVLAINGSADIQVPSVVSLKGIEAALTKGGNKQFTAKQFEGLNHLFQKCTKCTVPEYGELNTTIEPEVLDTIGSWLTALK
jgi:pimeloyl-ACP methyl ester carboxylesterase